ncbi:MAG: hypothetical protein QOD06_18 [Candidatus Binatota bacterium]|jgi:ketosteroid isomerase-like protein|nr:hypothetical protein [Candidatus Binatota bacterium]
MTTDALEADRREITRLHEIWFEANRGFRIEGMREVFAGGNRFHGFNLNGHTYGDREEWTTLWRHYQKTLDITDVPKVEKLHVVVKGDVAWLTCEATIRFRALSGPGTGSAALPADDTIASAKFRGTEVYVREDEDGRPVWKMWHCHYSPSAPETEPRPGFE